MSSQDPDVEFHDSLSVVQSERSTSFSILKFFQKN